MAVLFSHPKYFASGNWVVAGYNLVVSRAVGGSPNPYGPWTAVTGYTNYTQTTDILDPAGSYWDLYRVQPIVIVTLPNGTQSSPTALDFGRPFKASDILYDSQISSLLYLFRQNHLHDTGVKMRDSTNPQESTGGGVMPFITDSTTTRFYLSFLQNDNPIKIDPDSVQVVNGKATLAPYTDFYPSDDGGYIDFKTSPASYTNLRVDYTTYRYTHDQVRNMLTAAVNELSLYGINGYEVRVSNNLYYLATPLPNLDLGELICLIAFKNVLNSDIGSSLAESEAWKDGKVEYTSDPSRSLQAAAVHYNNIDEILRHQSSSYIYNTRQYLSRGEFTSFFDTTGVLPIYTLLVAGANAGVYAGWWM